MTSAFRCARASSTAAAAASSRASAARTSARAAIRRIHLDTGRGGDGLRSVEGWPVGADPAGVHAQGQAGELGQGEGGAPGVEPRRLDIGTGALRLDFRTRRVLGREVAGLDPPHCRIGELLGTLRQGLCRFAPLLRGKEIEEGGMRGQLLLDAHLFEIGAGGERGTLGGRGAKGALAAALPGEVDAD